MGGRDIAMDQANPFSESVVGMSGDDFAMLERAVAERRCRDELGFGTFAEAATLFRPDPPCPSCGDPAPLRDGTGAAGLRRYRCRACGRRFGPLTGTVLERSKKDMPTWAEFIRCMCWNVPIEAAAELCGISHQTAYEWRHRVFATVDGYQDKLVLRDRVWIDETYINDTDLTHGYGAARKRGLSKQKLCIAVAVDVHKEPFAAVCGHGKPTPEKARGTLPGHIAEGPSVVHDMENAHLSLVRADRCSDEAYKADVRDPEYLKCMAMADNLCSWPERRLWRLAGMDPANLQY